MPSSRTTSAPAPVYGTFNFDIMNKELTKGEVAQHLKNKLSSFNPAKMKQSYSVNGQTLEHKMTINVKNISFFQRVNRNHRPMMSVFTFNKQATISPLSRHHGDLYNHPLLNVHREQYAIPLDKKYASRTLNPFTGRRIKLSKDVFSESIGVQYQKTFLGIPFNISAENIILTRNQNRPLHPGTYAGTPQGRIQDIHVVTVQRQIRPSITQTQQQIRPAQTQSQHSAQR